MKKLLSLLLAALFVLMGVSAFAEASPAPIKVGVILPITGSQAAIGNRQLYGIQLAIKMANENGGIQSLGGAPIELVVADTTGSAQLGVTEIERLITSEGVCAVIGAYSSAVGASTAPVAERYGVPYMLTNASADEIMKNGYKYVFRANFCNGLDGKDLVKFLSELNADKAADIHKVAIVFENSDWGKGMSNGISNEIKENYADEFEVIINESYEADNADFSAIINKIKASEADIIIPMNYLNDALLFVQALADYRVNIPVLAHSGGYTVPEFLENAGSNADYIMTFAAWDTGVLGFKGELAAQINEKYKAEFSGGVDMDTYSANGWLGGSVMVNAIERAGSIDGDAIKDALAATELGADSYECALHPFKGISFAEPILGMSNQNIYGQSVILQMIDGKYTLIGPSSLVALGDTEIVWPIPEWSAR